MAIEFFTLSGSQDDVPHRQSGSRYSLDAATQISLSANGPTVSDYSKTGSDLVLRFSDGQQLDLENFFEIDPDGGFSQLKSSDGTPIITGLMAPEPIEADTETSIGTTADEGASITRSATQSFGEEAEDARDGQAEWSAPLMLTGAGLASGFAGINLLSLGDDGNGANGTDAAASARPTESQSGDPAEMAQEIEALVGQDDDEISLDGESQADLDGGAPPDQLIDQPIIGDLDVALGDEAVMSEASFGAGNDGWQSGSLSEAASGPDLLLDLMAEVEI